MFQRLSSQSLDEDSGKGNIRGGEKIIGSQDLGSSILVYFESGLGEKHGVQFRVWKKVWTV